jgi:hypothetical protein
MDEGYKKLGYKHFRGGLPVDEVDKLADLAYRLITPYRGELLRQDGKLGFNEFHPSTTLLKNSVSNAHLGLPVDLKPVEQSLRALITSKPIYEALHQLDGAEHYTVHQTLIFISAQTTVPHLDSWSMDTVPHGYAHTLWIPLEDVDYRAGVPGVVPWPVGKFVSEAELGLPEGHFTFRQRHDRYCDALVQRAMETGAEVCTSFMRRGDFLVWASLTPHFSFPSTPFPRRRVSLQVLVRPTHYPWGDYVEQPLPEAPSEQVSHRFAFLRRAGATPDYAGASSKHGGLLGALGQWTRR